MGMGLMTAYYLVRSAIRYRIMYLSLIPLLFVFFPTLVSCLYIESGCYIVEEDKFGVLNYASLFFIVFWILFIVAFIFAMRITLKPKYDTQQGPDQRLEIETDPGGEEGVSEITAPTSLPWLLFLTICLGILYFNLALSPVPFFDPSIFRFDYWKVCRFPFLHKFFGNTSLFIPIIIGLLLARYYKYQQSARLLWIIFFIYLIYLVLIGQKFGPIIYACFAFSLPVFIMSKKEITKKNIIIAVGSLSIIIVVLLMVIYYQYSMFNPFAAVLNLDLDIWDAIFYRALALQGHLWWGAFEKVVWGMQDPSWHVRDLLEGMHRLMFLLGANTTAVQTSIDKGISFAAGYPAILIIVFPLWLALLINVMLGFYFGLLGRICVYYIKKDDVLLATLCLQLYWFVLYIIEMGRFANLIEPKTLITGGLIIILILLENFLVGISSKMGTAQQLN